MLQIAHHKPIRLNRNSFPSEFTNKTRQKRCHEQKKKTLKEKSHAETP